jgi:3-hydroxyisobutyrate dehydrogenase-like beta-hydroxyacid dehydrogenase
MVTSMKNQISMGFVGFGEAGFELARGLHSAGTSPIYACDKTPDPSRSLWLKSRAREAGAIYLESIGEVVNKAEIILSVVPPEASLAAAQEAALQLRPGKMYLDLTSSFPGDMKTLSALIEPTGARFVDGAMMGALPIFGHKVLIYVSSPHAEEVARLLNQRGMNLQTVGKEPGQASAIKLILSISTKGLEALLLEMLLAAHPYEVEEQVLLAFNQFFVKGPEAMINRFVGSDAVHSGRRAKEMESSVRLLKSLGVDPIMTEATVQRLKWSASLGLSEYFKGISPEGYKEVIKAWENIGLFPKHRG